MEFEYHAGADPGAYLKVPEKMYHSVRAASASNLGHLKRSPAHLKAEWDAAEKDTPAFRLGRFAHSAILEHDAFHSDYAVISGNARTKAYKEEYAELVEEFGPYNVMKEDERETVLRMFDAVMFHATASEYLMQDGDSEVSLLWDDEVTGARCKARIDRLPVDASVGIVDLKTTTDASRVQFAKSLFAYGYHRQAAHYLMGLSRVLSARDRFTFVVVEKTPPYGVAVYEIDSGSLDAGLAEVNRLLALYQRCHARNEWPGYPDIVQDISIPPWAFAAIDDDASAATITDVGG